MPKVSIIIPTHDRPQLLGKALNSILKQSFGDYEAIVVDDGLKERAGSIVKELDDDRIRYIAHDRERGGSAARNTGIKNASGRFLAFLDDDDEWLPQKLERQLGLLEGSDEDVGFCFSSVIRDYGDKEEKTYVKEGVADYAMVSLSRFKGFLTSTLLVKREVFEEIGLFDESLPSHQEAELMIRISKRFKGIGIDEPLVKMSCQAGHEHIGGNIDKKIAGRLLVLKKHEKEYEGRKDLLAKHYFWMALWLRDAGRAGEAIDFLKRSLRYEFKFNHFFHLLYLESGLKKWSRK